MCSFKRLAVCVYVYLIKTMIDDLVRTQPLHFILDESVQHMLINVNSGKEENDGRF